MVLMDKDAFVISSHNICGYNNSKEFLYHQCDNNVASIFAIQEHWLKPPIRKKHGTNCLKVLHPKYDAHGVSGMSRQIGDKISKGRPYGGTGFIYHREFSKSIRPRLDLSHERVSVVELKTDVFDVLLINAYFPYYDTSRINEQLILYRETLAFIENVVTSNPCHKYILMADFNANIYNLNHPYTRLIRDFMRDYDLFSCYDLLPGFDHTSHCTRFDIKRGSYTLIDGMILSNSLRPWVTDISISQHHMNVSDHIPVRLTLNVNVDVFDNPKGNQSYFIPWNSLSSDDLLKYQSTMANELDKIVIPVSTLNHCTQNCCDSDHMLVLENYYEQIVKAIVVADCSLPRRRRGISKGYWSDELTELKQKSFDAFSLWELAGSPKNGPIFQEKENARLNYKRCLRKSKRNDVDSISHKLSHGLNGGDFGTFWKEYRRADSGNIPPSTIIDGFVDNKDIVGAFSKT